MTPDSFAKVRGEWSGDEHILYRLTTTVRVSYGMNQTADENRNVFEAQKKLSCLQLHSLDSTTWMIDDLHSSTNVASSKYTLDSEKVRTLEIIGTQLYFSKLFLMGTCTISLKTIFLLGFNS